MKLFVSALLSVGFFLGCSSTREVKNLDLKISWNLETNYQEDGGHRAIWTIQNNSNVVLTRGNWALYWNMAPREIKAGSITAPVTMRWINGDFYEMKPTVDFELKKGETMKISYEGSNFMIKESDAPLGVYSLYTGADGAKETYPVIDYTIEPFDSPDQINRNTSDLVPIPTAEWLYDNNSGITEIPEDEMELVVPTPMKTNRKEGTVAITAQTVINYQNGLEKEAELLSEQLSIHLSGQVSIQVSDAGGEGIVSLKKENRSVDGAYTLGVGNGGVTISGNPAGVFYGSQSLLALIPVNNLGQNSESILIPAVHIEDRPAFRHRGMFVDITRNFNSVSTMMKLVDIMAFYKLNSLHIHLSEDEAWRIEIEELPELTQFGAFRGHTTDDSENLQPSYGSGPSTDPSSGYGSGYYSREEYKSLIQYAWDRHIRVIPEINIPGH